MPRRYVLSKPKIMANIVEDMPGLSKAIRDYNEKVMEARTVRRYSKIWGRINSRNKESKENQEKLRQYAQRVKKTTEIEDFCERFQKRLALRRQRASNDVAQTNK